VQSIERRVDREYPGAYAVVLDMEGTPTWAPAGANDNFLFCDGACGFTIANAVTQTTGAGGNYVIT